MLALPVIPVRNARRKSMNACQVHAETVPLVKILSMAFFVCVNLDILGNNVKRISMSALLRLAKMEDRAQIWSTHLLVYARLAFLDFFVKLISTNVPLALV